MRMLLNILGFIVLLVTLALLAAPYALVIRFPEQAEHFTAISRTIIPWVAVLLLFLIFNEGVKNLIISISGAIGRLRKISAVGTVADLETSQAGIQLTSDQIQQITTTVQTESTWAWLFFIKYVHTTIFRSQYELLDSMDREGDKASEELAKHYNRFLSRKPEDFEYSFESWMEYLSTNLLVQFDEPTRKYQLTKQGRVFVLAVRQYGASTNFNY